jgi:hypothetical protein
MAGATDVRRRSRPFYFCNQRISDDVTPYQQIFLPGDFAARIALAEEFQLLIVLRCKIAKMPPPPLAHVPNGAHNHDCYDYDWFDHGRHSVSVRPRNIQPRTQLLGSVAAALLTRDNLLQAPSFAHMRAAKNAMERCAKNRPNEDQVPNL